MSTIKKSSSRKSGVSHSKRAGIHFPVRAVKRQINHGRYGLRCGEETALYLGAMLEYIAVETVGAAATESNRCRDPALKGVVTAGVIDSLVGTDKTRTYAALMRDLIPFHPHTVCAGDEDIVTKAATKPKRSQKKKTDDEQ